jgi:hypothetical protein
MKKICVLLLVFILFASFGFVVAEEPSVSGVPDDAELGEVKEKIEDLSPLDESGDFDFNKYTPYKSWGEERLVSVNKYVGGISKFLFGVELSLSWLFVFSVLLFIMLFVFVFNIAGELFSANALFSYVFSFIVSALSMHSFGKDFVVWVDTIATTWWITAAAIAVGIVSLIVYTIFMKVIGKKMRASRLAGEKGVDKQNREILRVQAEAVKKELFGMKED